MVPALIWRRLSRNQRRASKVRGLRQRLESRRQKSSWRSEASKPTSTSIWQRAGLVVLFALMAGAGFGAYAGYARMIRTPGFEDLAHVQRRAMPPTLWVRTAHPLATTHAPDEMGAWLSKAEGWTAVAAMVIFGDVADAVVSHL